VLAITTVELCGREVARRSMLHGLLGLTLSAGTLVAIAFVAAGVAILRTRGRSVTPVVLTASLAAGLALQLELGARLQSDSYPTGSCRDASRPGTPARIRVSRRTRPDADAVRGRARVFAACYH
jgi:hypothetical protein